MKTLKYLPFALMLFILPLQSNAWGLLGHRVVAEVAESYLTPKARAAIKKILGDESMAMAANWADFIKSDTNYRYLYNWHFVNFPDSMSYMDIKTFLSKDSIVNVYTKTNWIVQQLKNKNLAKDKQVLYLRLLIHFIGDIHQPLHTGRETDLGGNKVKVTWFGEATNLHSVWDTKLVDDQQLSYTEYAKAVNHSTAAQRAAWQKQPFSEWIYESYLISRKIYQATPSDSKLGYNYIFDWIGTANSQMSKGGVRLAGMLNVIFK